MTPSNLSQYDCIFFDFDGVIVDSVEAKITAFGELYAEFGPDVRREVEAYQRAVPGETRFDKIPRFHRDLLGQELSEAEIGEWCDRLRDLVLDEVVACPLMEDVPEILGTLQRINVPAHIVSGTPHDELQVIVEQKGLAPFFKTARGAPERKTPIVNDILGREGFARERCLFVGDAMTDYNCAVDCGLDFLGRADAAHDPFPAGTRVVERLGEYFLAAPAPTPTPAPTPVDSRRAA